jgi:pimeloyl-ACP methyl ester carboxylesterase
VADAELTRIEELLAAGDREEGLAAALRSFGLSPKELEQLRASPTWRPRLELAHTIPREARAEAGCRFDARRLGQLTAPVLLLLGEESPAWAAEGTERIRSVLPGARVALLRGQGHAATVTAPELVADELARFLEAG